MQKIDSFVSFQRDNLFLEFVTFKQQDIIIKVALTVHNDFSFKCNQQKSKLKIKKSTMGNKNNNNRKINDNISQGSNGLSNNSERENNNSKRVNK